MAQIRHLAIVTDNPKKLAEFYTEAFGLEVKGTGYYGDVWLSDGHIDVALIPHRENVPAGLNHFGFTLENEAERDHVYKVLDGLGIKTFNPGPNRPYVEEAARDTDGNRFDISVKGLTAKKLQ